MNVNDILTSPDCVRKAGVFNYRRFRPLEDLNSRGTPGEENSPLPKIYEEDDKENRESTPRRRVVYKAKGREGSEAVPTSSTPLSRRHPTPKTPKCSRPIPHNPFEAELMSRIHLPMCSPSVFSVIVSPSKSLDENFDWPIEDVSRIKPVAIEEFPESQFHFVEDPETESRVQEAIDMFFKEKHIVPSPWSSDEDRRSFLQKAGRTVETKDGCTQTALSLPWVLPPELEEALRPYFNQESNDVPSSPSSTDELLSQSGLRRKLMFHVNVDDCPDSPLLDVCWEQGLSRTDMQSHVAPRSPTLSPIGREMESPHRVMSHTSMEVSFQRTPIVRERQDAWPGRHEGDQTMESCHGTPVSGNSPRDHGYHSYLSHCKTTEGAHD